jgi:dipeptidyl aminopeptidase/acylaminoacyl peptidase
MSLEDLFAPLHRLGRVGFSSDGQQITYEYKGFWITDRQGNSERLTEGGAPRWMRDFDQLAFLRGNPAQIWMWDTSGQEQQRTRFPRGVSDYAWSADGQHFAVITPGEEAPRMDKPKLDTIIELHRPEIAPGDELWLVTIASGEMRRGAAAAPGVRWSQPAAQPDGRQIALMEEGYEDEAEHVALVDSADGRMERPVAHRIRPCRSPRWSPDGQRLAFLYSPHNYGYPLQLQCAVVPVQEGRPSAIACYGEGYFISEADELCWHPDGQAIFAVGLRGSTRQLLRIDLASGEVRALTHELGWCGSPCISPDGTWLAFTFTSPTCIGRLCLLPTEGGPVQTILDVDEPLREFHLAEVELVHWRAEDGMELEGVLLKPLDYQAGRRYPLIVDLHGGPAPGGTAFFVPRWHWLASQGYLVFSPDFRSGQTYSWVEPEAQDLDSSDTMAGVDALIDAGYADPDRMGFFGFSYGADLGAWVLGHTQRFRAAVIQSGGYDWIVGYGLSGGWTTFSKALGGPPWEAWEAYRRFSPLTYLHRATTPTLLLTGDRDLVHIRMIHTWLRRAGVEVEAIHYKGEGHSISQPQHRRDWLERMLSWFDRHLK